MHDFLCCEHDWPATSRPWYLAHRGLVLARTVFWCTMRTRSAVNWPRAGGGRAAGSEVLRPAGQARAGQSSSRADQQGLPFSASAPFVALGFVDGLRHRGSLRHCSLIPPPSSWVARRGLSLVGCLMGSSEAASWARARHRLPIFAPLINSIRSAWPAFELEAK